MANFDASWHAHSDMAMPWGIESEWTLKREWTVAFLSSLKKKNSFMNGAMTESLHCMLMLEVSVPRLEFDDGEARTLQK